MKPYQVEFTSRAKSELDSLIPPIRARIEAVAYALANDPRPHGCKKLKSRDEYRVRVGDYWIVYKIQDKVLTVTVVRISHRKDAYR